MAMSHCSSCNTTFTGLNAFDAHLKPIHDERATLVCQNPLDIGLVAKYNGSTLRGYGYPATDSNPFVRQEGNTMRDTLIRECTECAGAFVKFGRGRPPTKCADCGGKADVRYVAKANIGRYLREDGTVADERLAPEVVVKPKAAKAPAKQDYRSKNERDAAAAKPATAKAVRLAQPIRPADAPAERTYAQVPLPPPPARVDGATLVEALASGDVHPDTFAEPPHAEDSYASLYGESEALIRPEPDDYMHDLLASGSLRGYSMA